MNNYNNSLTYLVGCLPNALDEDSALVSSFPGLMVILVVEADVAEFVHVRGDYSREENVHMPVFKDLNLLIFLQFKVVQMIVINVNLEAKIGCLSLLDLNQGVTSHEIRSLVPVQVGKPVLALADGILWLV